MECRLYQGGTGRTRLNVLKLTKNDYVFMVFCTIFFVIMIIASVVGI